MKKYNNARILIWSIIAVVLIVLSSFSSVVVKAVNDDSRVEITNDFRWLNQIQTKLFIITDRNLANSVTDNEGHYIFNYNEAFIDDTLIGIVIDAKDMLSLTNMPGLVTDMSLRTIRKLG